MGVNTTRWLTMQFGRFPASAVIARRLASGLRSFANYLVSIANTHETASLRQQRKKQGTEQ